MRRALPLAVALVLASGAVVASATPTAKTDNVEMVATYHPGSGTVTSKTTVGNCEPMHRSTHHGSIEVVTENGQRYLKLVMTAKQRFQYANVEYTDGSKPVPYTLFVSWNGQKLVPLRDVINERGVTHPVHLLDADVNIYDPTVPPKKACRVVVVS